LCSTVACCLSCNLTLLCRLACSALHSIPVTPAKPCSQLHKQHFINLPVYTHIHPFTHYQYDGRVFGSINNLFVLVANCGDSRMLTDDGTKSPAFRQITRDHRPTDTLEAERLKLSTLRGEASLVRTGSNRTLRIFPGGLAVSRDIGDLSFSKAAIPTPDIFLVEIPKLVPMTVIDNSSEFGSSSFALDQSEVDDIDKLAEKLQIKPKSYRFVLASDGLWDVLSNELVGKHAAQTSPQGVPISPAKAAAQIMECCLLNEGYHDDVTILVLDITPFDLDSTL
jgi:serine/threonine protein phosphatase PrpC